MFTTKKEQRKIKFKKFKKLLQYAKVCVILFFAKILIKSNGGTGPVKLRQPIIFDKVPIPRDETYFEYQPAEKRGLFFLKIGIFKFVN